MRKYRNYIIAGVAFGFFILVAILLLSDARKLAEDAATFAWWVMLPVLGLRVFNWCLRFIKWHIYIGIVGVRDISIRDSAALYVTGFTLPVSPGKVAELLKAFVLRNMTGAPVAATAPVIAAERLTDGVAVLLLMVLSTAALSADEFWPVVIAAISAMALGFAVLQYRPLSTRLLDLAVRLPLVRRFAEPMRALYESSYELFRPKNFALAVSLGTVANFTDGIGVYLILLGLGLPPSEVLFFQALLIISLSVVVGSMSALPGGLGAADLSIGMTMQTLVGLGLSEAGFVTLLARFVQLWFGVLAGFVVGFIFRAQLFPPSLDAVIAEESARRMRPRTVPTHRRVTAR